MMPIPGGGRPTGTKLEGKSFLDNVLMEEREDIELEVSIMGGEALAGSVTTLENAEEAKGDVPVPCLMAADFLSATGLDIPFLLVGLLGAMIQKTKEKRQITRRQKEKYE